MSVYLGYRDVNNMKSKIGTEILMDANVGFSQEGFISLKEAGRISGYSPDYVGQLIRQGKIDGKQVYCNVAWMTTAKAIREYLARNSGEKIIKPFEWREQLFKMMPRVLPAFLYVVIGLLALFTLFIFYIVATNVNARLDERAISKVGTKSVSTGQYESADR